MDKCIYCGSANLQQQVDVAQRNEIGAIGLSYKVNFLFYGVESFYADLCKDCGTVSRLYVKNSDRNWSIEKE
jgi:hypothetical protein